MSLELNKCELAWASGFFDGEGSTSSRNKHQIPVLTIGQIDTYVLERFKNAVGCGTIYGPYKRKVGHWKPQYNYQSGNFEQTQNALCKIWNWLSPQKKAQAVKVFNEYRTLLDSKPDMRTGSKLCKRGHDTSEPDAIIYTSRQRRCRKCHNQVMTAWKERQGGIRAS